MKGNVKRSIKKTIAVMLSVIVCSQLVACGDKKEKENEENKYAYEAEFEKLGTKSNVEKIDIIDNTLYYIGTNWNNDKQEGLLYSMNMSDKKTEQVPIALKENSTLDKTMMANDQTFWLLQNVFGEIETMSENAVPESTTYLTQINLKGEQLQEIDITEVIKTEGLSFVSNMAIDGEGNIYLSNGNSLIWVLKSNGELSFTIPLNNWIMGMSVSKDGIVFVLENSIDGNILKAIDVSKKGFGKTYPVNLELKGNETLIAGVDTDFLISSVAGFSTYDLEKNEIKTLFKWSDCNISSSSVKNYTMLEDGTVLVLLEENLVPSGGTTMVTTAASFTEIKPTELATIKKVLASEVVEKTILTYGTLSLEQSVEKDIVDFNKSNKKYKIEIKEYANTEDAIAQFNADIASGNVIDLIDLKNGVDFKSYSEKGIFEDLYPYIEKDESFKLEDFFENILKIYEKDGKLYGVLDAFAIYTLFGKTADIGDKHTWTMEEFMEFLSDYPDDIEVFDGGTKNDVLSLCISSNIDNYINWKTGECSFNTKEFQQVLELANRFPKTRNYNAYSPSLPTKLQTGQQLLNNVYIASMFDMQMFQKMFQDDVTVIGFPVSKGSGSLISPIKSIAINAKSMNKDGAWEFVRTFLLGENINIENMFGFPIQKKIFDERMEFEMKPKTYIDEDGVEQISNFMCFYDDWNANLKAPTKEEVKQLKDIITSATTESRYHDELLNIIKEEADSFFNGVKSSTEVSEVIQNRIQLFVKEKK